MFLLAGLFAPSKLSIMVGVMEAQLQRVERMKRGESKADDGREGREERGKEAKDVGGCENETMRELRRAGV